MLDGDRLNAGKLPPNHRSLVIFYRGKHCPKCKTQLREFDSAIDQFAEVGIRLFAASMDDEKTAHETQRECEIE